MTLLLMLAALLVLVPAPQAAPAADFGVYVGSFLALSSTVIVVTEFAVKTLSLRAFIAQASSWIVTALVVAACTFFDIGYLAHATIIEASVNGLAVALVANRIADAGTLDRFLEALRLKPKSGG